MLFMSLVYLSSFIRVLLYKIKTGSTPSHLKHCTFMTLWWCDRGCPKTTVNKFCYLFLQVYSFIKTVWSHHQCIIAKLLIWNSNFISSPEHKISGCSKQVKFNGGGHKIILFCSRWKKIARNVLHVTCCNGLSFKPI